MGAVYCGKYYLFRLIVPKYIFFLVETDLAVPSTCVKWGKGQCACTPLCTAPMFVLLPSCSKAAAGMSCAVITR